MYPSLSRLFCCLSILALSACASGPAKLKLIQEAGSEIVWPAPPEKARYRYLGQLTGEDNLVVDEDSRQIGRRVFDWLVGLTSAPEQAVVLRRPQGGYTDDKGNIYVTDVSRAAVFVFDKELGALDVWEMADKQTRFVSPIAIEQGEVGTWYVSDSELSRVAVLDSAGKPTGQIGREVLKRPTGLAYDTKKKLLYVADTATHDIKVFDKKGDLVRKLGRKGVGPGEFNAPTYLSFHDGELYVSDTLNARIQVLDRDGQSIRSFGRRGLYVGDMPRPKGVAVDRSGRTYVVESYYDFLLVFDDKGQFLLPIGGTGSSEGRFYLPAGVWVDRLNRIYVADTFNGRVVVLGYLDGAH